MIACRNATHTLQATLQILLMIYFMPFTTRAECPQPRKGKWDSSLAQAPLEQPELRSRHTGSFFPTDMTPEAAEMQDKTQKALIGLPAWLIFIIASNSNPYYSHTIPRLPPKELFSASELLTQQFKHTGTQTLWCYPRNSPALLPTQNLQRVTGLPFWVSWTVLPNKEVKQPYNWTWYSKL